MEASYDVISMVHSRENNQSSDEEKDDNHGHLPTFRQLKSFFSKRGRMKKSKSRELAEMPGAYWEVCAEDFRTALSLNPMLAQTASLNNECNQNTRETFKTTDNLLDDKKDAPPMEKSKFACVNRKKKAKLASPNLQPVHVRKSEFYTVKILVLGDQDVGKSSIIRRFVHGTFVSEKPDDIKLARCNYQVKIVNFDKLDYILHIYDIGEQIPDTGNNQLKGAIIVFDVNDPNSFASVKKWKNMLELETPCLLLANKCDEAKTSINRTELSEYCAHRAIAGWFDTSAKNNLNLTNAFIALLRNIIESHRDRRLVEDIRTIL